jgi:hypothetical protein
MNLWSLCRNPSLGFATKTKGLARLWAKRNPESHTACSWECRKVWRNEPSHSQSNSHFGRWSQWTPKSSKGDCRGQNSMDWKVPYIIGKFLELRCLKWVRMTHLNIQNTSYGQKKGQESNCQFDSRPLKVGNWPDFPVCKLRATYHWKALDKGYNFALKLISIRGFHAKLWGPKIAGVPTLAIRNSHLGIPGQNAIWMWASWAAIEYTIRGKVVASPKSGPWWVLWVQICLSLVLTPKMFQLCTNQLVVWFCADPCEWLNACHSS